MEFSLNITFDEGTDYDDIANAFSIAGDRASERTKEMVRMEVDGQIDIPMTYPGVQNAAVYRLA